MNVADGSGARHTDVFTRTPARGLPARTFALERPLLRVENLGVYIEERGERIDVVDRLSYDVFRSATLAIIGESGSGKSMSCRALLGLLPSGAKAAGSVRYEGEELLGLAERQMRWYRGRRIAMVFQDAERALNPTMQIGRQIGEAIRAHESLGRRTTQRRALELLHLLKLPKPQRLFFAYPHELSGGMRQRVMIAVAIAPRPSLLIADEPTSAVDVSTGIEIMDLLKELRRQLDMALILVSHDIRLVASLADSVLVMRAGRPVEYASASRLIARPDTEYTKALVDATPRLEPLPPTVGPPQDHRDRRSSSVGRARDGEVVGSTRPTSHRIAARDMTLLLDVRCVGHEYGMGRFARTGGLQAVCDISFDLMPGEILGIVGETGCGKSTLARALVQTPPPSRGSVFFRGQDLTRMSGRRLREQRRQMQLISQDPFASLNPRWRVSEIVEEPLIGYDYGAPRKRRLRVADVLELVGLPLAVYGKRRPGQLSGGECQRIAIARALALEPQLIICDEPLSSLDTLNQRQIVTLFERLRAELDIAFLFISHDLARVRELSDRVLVMYSGRLCEVGPAASLCRAPFHPYMAALLESVTSMHPCRSGSFGDDRRSPGDSPTGCRFGPRCDRARERCALETPGLTSIADDHLVACHFPIRR